MRILVAGGAGFIGANFAHRMHALGHEVLVYDLLTYAGNPRNVEGLPHFVQGDVCDAAALSALFERRIGVKGFDVVVNFAAESHVDRSISLALPFVRTNVLGTVTLLEAARAHGVPIFVQISTDEVYGSITGEERFTLRSPIRPSSAYSASKAAADHLVLSYHHTHGYDVRVTRCTNNYGRFQHPEKFIPTVLRSALAGKPIPVYGDGLYIRDWIHVDDHTSGIVAVIERGTAGSIHHFGGPQMPGNEAGITNLDLVRMILAVLAEETGRTSLEDLITFVTDRPGHDRRYALDWSDSQRELGWSPTVALQDGLRSTIRWWLENLDWWSGVEGTQ